LELWHRVERCEVCGSTNFHEHLRARDPHYANEGEFSYSRCNDCGLLFLNPMPTQAYLDTAYPDGYYSFQPPSLPSPSTRAFRAFLDLVRPFLLLRLQRTRDPEFEAPGTMLDIGCGAGKFLYQMKSRGWNVKGVEISRQAAEVGRKAGLDIFGGTLLDANFPAQYFDYIRSNHSFEHVINPREVLREIRRIIKPDGRLFIGVPNVDSWAARIFGPYWYNLGPPVHVFGYTISSLSKLAEQEGFRVERAICNSKITSITGSLQIYVNRNKGLTAEVGGIIRNPLLRLPAHWLTTLADWCRKGDGIEITFRPS
jgi:SAM-dependent methyltransferase